MKPLFRHFQGTKVCEALLERDTININKIRKKHIIKGQRELIFLSLFLVLLKSAMNEWPDQPRKTQVCLMST